MFTDNIIIRYSSPWLIFIIIINDLTVTVSDSHFSSSLDSEVSRF